jgi:hypothetical protein
MDAWAEAGNAISELFKWLDTNWLGTVLKSDMPPAWNGAWPGQATTVLQFEPGGRLDTHVERWKALARSGDSVEVRGPCFSGCTLVVAYVPRERLCFGEYSLLYFHFPRDALTGIVNFRSKEQMWDSYPDDIQKWLATRTFDNLVFADFWELKAEELWAMGYRKCKFEPAPPMDVR